MCVLFLKFIFFNDLDASNFTKADYVSILMGNFLKLDAAKLSTNITVFAHEKDKKIMLL